MKNIFTSLLLLIGLNLPAQVTNPGFENINIGDVDTVAANWHEDDFGCNISLDAHTGMYAMEVWNWYYYAKGYTVNGEISSSTPVFPGTPYLDGGEPISFSPVALNGFYKYDTAYTDTNADSAYVQIVLSKYDAGSAARNVIGFGEARLTVAGNYTPFHIPVQYTSTAMPDTVTVALVSSTNGFCDISSAGNCLYFKVDDLVLETTTGLVDFGRKNEVVKTYPNPATDLITIDAGGIVDEVVDCTIISVNGDEVMQMQLNRNRAQVNISTLENGLYFYQLKKAGGLVVYTGKVEVLR